MELDQRAALTANAPAFGARLHAAWTRRYRRFRAWRHSEDSLVASANSIALLVASNTPFYPFYVWWVAGSGGMPYLWATLCSLPFFLAVPEVARRNARLGRAMLPVVGVANSVFCTWLIGAEAGTELFNLPCIIIGAQLFRAHERLMRLALIGLPIAVLLLLHGHYGTPPYRYSDAQYQALFALNLFSVASLIGFLGLVFVPSGSGPHQPADQQPDAGGDPGHRRAPDHVGDGQLQRPDP